MLLTKREEQLLKAFQDYGKLSLNQLADMLKVSRRTVYRTIAGLTESMKTKNVAIVKEDGKYFLAGQVAELSALTTLTTYSQEERLNLITYKLIWQDLQLTNEQLQAEFGVSNVTIIQDIALIEERLADFTIFLKRQQGYGLADSSQDLRRFLAILLTNNISIADFAQEDYGYFQDLDFEKLSMAKQVFQTHQADLPELDSRLSQFFIILLALSGFAAESNQAISSNLSRVALDLAQKIYTDFSQATAEFYNIQEILYFASVLDELVVKRQETPLFTENFDSEFFYKVSNLIDKVSLYTKINFVKDPVLFRFLFNHIRLNLATPVIFPDYSKASISYSAAHRNEHLHNVVSLLVQELFPKYLQNELEYELITLHFASSLRRSPHIYPIRILLLTDERPLARELLITRIKTIAPFVDKVTVKDPSAFQAKNKTAYHCVLSTKPQTDEAIHVISLYPDAKEVLALQDFLQSVQANQTVILEDEDEVTTAYDLQAYFLASQDLLEDFTYQTIDNPSDFKQTVPQLIAAMDFVKDATYLSQKLLSRFEISPLAIPETNLALLHTQSSRVSKSCFAIYNLTSPVTALSMNKEEEVITRILVMLTKLDEKQEIRDLMTAISQSLIENHLYTEIYKTGNRQIIYQLLKQIFTEKIKKLET